MQRGVHLTDINPKSYHLIDSEPVNSLLYIYFPNFECGIFLKTKSQRCCRLLRCDFITSLISEALILKLPSSAEVWHLGVNFGTLVSMLN